MAEDLGGAEIVHAITGRIRFRFPGIKGHARRARGIKGDLSALPGVRRVEASSVTGSVLVEYDPGKMEVFLESSKERFPEIERAAGELATILAPVAQEVEMEMDIAKVIVGAFRGINAKLKAITGGVDLRVIVPLVLFFFGLRGFVLSKQKALPSWHALLWFSFATFIALNPRQNRTNAQLGNRGIV